MISILMPIYNGIEFICQSINSIKKQSISNWELIIGINGHPPNSEVYQKAKEYENHKIKVIELYPIKGKSEALNNMLKYCTYDWIALLDVDDIWLPKKLESQLPYMTKYDVIGTKCRYFGEREGEPNIPSGDIAAFNFLQVNPIINSSCLVRKELCGWDATKEGVEDYDMWLRLWKAHKKFYNVESIQVFHRIHRKSAFNARGNHRLIKKLTGSICVVFLCNRAYFSKFCYTCKQLIEKGNYRGDICLVIGDDMKNVNNHPFIKQVNRICTKIEIKYFPHIPFNKEFIKIQQQLKRPKHWFKKIFQYHKLHLFDVYFKKWDYILYLDCGLHIFSDISPIIATKEKNVLLANRDGTNSEKINLTNQFVSTHPIYHQLEKDYNLNIKSNCMQTTLMLYDTSIIGDDTFETLYKLMLKYPISKTNDQGIIALYFMCIKPRWKQIKRKNKKTYFYDYVREEDAHYIIYKDTSRWLINSKA